MGTDDVANSDNGMITQVILRGYYKIIIYDTSQCATNEEENIHLLWQKNKSKDISQSYMMKCLIWDEIKHFTYKCNILYYSIVPYQWFAESLNSEWCWQEQSGAETTNTH